MGDLRASTTTARDNGPARPRRKASITLRLVMMQGIIVLMVATIIGVASYRVMVSHFKVVQESETRAIANSVASLVGNDVKGMGEVVEQLAKGEAVAKYYRSFSPATLAQAFTVHNNLFPEITYANALGEEEVKLRQGDLSSDLRDIGRSESYNQAERTPNKVIISTAQISSVLGQPIITLSYRYHNYFDQFLGHIQASLPLSHFDQVIKEIELDNNVYVVLVNAEGEILHAPDARWLGKPFKTTDTDLALVGAAPATTTVLGRYRLLGSDTVVTRATVPNLGWSIFVAIPAATYFGPTKDLTHAMVVVGLIALLIGLVVAYLFAHSLAQPIKLLTRATSEISAQGSLTERVQWQSADELGELAHSFNQMLDQLARSQTDLLDARHEVEDILRSMADCLMVVHPDATIIKVNDATIRQLGYSEEALIGMPLDTLIADDKGLFRAVLASDLATDDRMSSIETTLITRDQRRIPVVFSRAPMVDSNGKKRGVVFVARDITDRKRAEEHLHYLANHDALTGLPNRLLFLDRLSQAMSRLPWHDRTVALLYLDLDRFKTINDTLGHDIGDLLLMGVAERLSKCVRDGDTVARLGGDEFVILLNDINKRSDVEVVAEKIIRSLSVPFELAGEEFVATTSIGISQYPEGGEDPHILLKNADTAMYRAKESGRNTFKLYAAAMNEKAMEALRMESAIRHGLDRHEFILHYQPQVSLESGRIIAVEALIRWQHPEEGLVPPFKFLPVAEETGLILPMGEQVLYMACRQAAQWLQAGRPLKVAVNIANRQFKHINLPQLVSKVLDETGLPPELLDLELTEGILMDQVDKAIKTLESLRQMGVSLSLDDFGTGYSSLSYLKKFALDTLKIDRSFVMDIPIDRDDVAITRAVVEMGRSLGLEVVAEGVENVEQLLFLKQLGCQSMQGFYFSKPVAAAEIEEMLRTGRAIDTSSGQLILM